MDRDQFIAQVKTQQNALRSFLLALCGGNFADADDIAQESLVKAYLAIDSYTDSGKFKSWLFKIAHNTFLNHTAALKQYDSIEAAETVATQDPPTTISRISNSISHSPPYPRKSAPPSRSTTSAATPSRKSRP